MSDTPVQANEGQLHTPEYLYGLPHAEHLQVDPAEVWETDIDPYDDAGPDRWVIEKFMVSENTEWTRAGDIAAENEAEYASENQGLEGSWDHWANAAKDPEVVAAFETALNLLASKVRFWGADAKVGEHVITLDADGEPLLDGEPMYRKATP